MGWSREVPEEETGAETERGAAMAKEKGESSGQNNSCSGHTGGKQERFAEYFGSNVNTV